MSEVLGVGQLEFFCLIPSHGKKAACINIKTYKTLGVIHSLKGETMSDEKFDIPEWMIDRIAESYKEEMLKMRSEGYMLDFVTGWHGKDLSISVLLDGEEMGSDKFSLEALCTEPAQHWHNGSMIDQQHYDLIGEIAQELKKQSERLFAVQASLKIDRPTRHH